MNSDEELIQTIKQMQEENACKKCGTTENVVFEGMCKNCYEKSIGAKKNNNIEYTNDTEYTNSSNSNNMVASKFIFIVKMTKILGYGLALISLIFIAINVNFLTGVLVGEIIASVTWFSTLAFEAIAEIINLLQDIKNKLGGRAWKN